MIANSQPAGLYVHVPFCKSKCLYCDFYSLEQSNWRTGDYLHALGREAERFRSRGQPFFDTLYLGGGTPTAAGSDYLADLVRALTGVFSGCFVNTETTVECNPEDTAPVDFDFAALAGAGVNRLSFGLQAYSPEERDFLGRRGTPAELTGSVRKAAAAGITNFSVDLIIGIPGQSEQSLGESIAFCAAAGARHVSAYLLKAEPGTLLYEHRASFELQDDDAMCDLYLFACERLEEEGFAQYEISNFARPGFESRHNLKYWRLADYLGLGPGAHSLLEAERFHYPRDLGRFIVSGETCHDGPGGDFGEYLMLALRLNEGFDTAAAGLRYPGIAFDKLFALAQPLEKAGLLRFTLNGFALTRKGFLVSNAVIGRLLEAV